MREDRPDIYDYFGTYPNGDARLLLDAFVSGDIEFTLHVDNGGIQVDPNVLTTGRRI